MKLKIKQRIVVFALTVFVLLSIPCAATAETQSHWDMLRGPYCLVQGATALPIDTFTGLTSGAASSLHSIITNDKYMLLGLPLALPGGTVVGAFVGLVEGGNKLIGGTVDTLSLGNAGACELWTVEDWLITAWHVEGNRKLHRGK